MLHTWYQRHDHLTPLRGDLGDHLLDGRNQALAAWAFDDVHVVSAGLQDLGDRADLLALRGHYPQPNDLVPVESSTRQLPRFALGHLHQPAPELVGGVPVLYLV